MNDLSPLVSINGNGNRPLADGNGGGTAAIAAELRRLAGLGSELCPGAACLISWDGSRDAAIMRAVPDARLNPRLDALFAVVERDQRYRPSRLNGSKHYADANDDGGLLRFGDRELAAACGRQSQGRTCFAAAVSINASAEPAARATVILIAPAAASGECDLLAAAELIARAAIGILRADAAGESRDFWRAQTAGTAQRLAIAKAELSGNVTESARIDRAAAMAEKLSPRGRLRGLGAGLAKLGPFDAWMIAIVEEGTLRVSAFAGVNPPPSTIGAQDTRASAMADCFRRQSKILRTTPPGTGADYVEDALFARFGAYLCIPLASGAIALAAGDSIDAAMVARAEAVALRINPLIDKWLLEADNDRLRRLVRNLGLRMFGAVDAERARIARDLHDNQAQLLAAARIGIEAGPDKARLVFRQLEDALRRRVRELKPPTLGRSTLAEGLRHELRRLADTGLKTRLIHADRMSALTRPVQQVCFQVAREALANVVRHANASRVEIGIEKVGHCVRLSILDNGRGIGTTNGAGGMGLTGLNERLELMGGRLLVESKAGSTRLVAEIPELS